MEKENITRAQLESLSNDELRNIADEYSIDVSESFKRNSLIAEILEVVLENKEDSNEFEMNLIDDDLQLQKEDETLPRSYNSTEVEIILRNPAWAYIYWNISESDRHSLEEAFISEMQIRVNSFSEKDQIKPDEFFDIRISKKDSGQYFLLPHTSKFFRVDLLFNLDGIIDILASSDVLEMPTGTQLLAETHPGKNENLSEIMKLSGMEDLLLQHYKNHRESFS